MEPAAEFVNDLEVCNASGRFVVFHSTTLTRLVGGVSRSAWSPFTLELIRQA
jgi:hypothetical protein